MKCLALGVSVSLLGLGACVADLDAREGQTQQNEQVSELAPKHELPVRDAAKANKIGNSILYHGGPLLNSGVNVYTIWYGNWSSTAETILTNFVQHVGGSPYFNINSTYYDANNVHVANIVNYKGASTDNYSRGTSLADADIATIVASQISSGRLPADPSAVYFVLTSSDVDESSGFCTSYCGWHTHGTVSGLDLKYAFVGNPDRCPSACEAQTTSPNGDSGADGAASIVAHELEEATTDPDLNAWYDRKGLENADKCAWTFGTEATASNGAKYNVVIGGLEYLIQQNWVYSTASCAMSY